MSDCRCRGNSKMHLPSATVVVDVGTCDYNELKNKPRINGVELVGDLSTFDLKIGSGGDIATDQDVNDIFNGSGNQGGQDENQDGQEPDAPDGYEIADNDDIDELFS